MLKVLEGGKPEKAKRAEQDAVVDGAQTAVSTITATAEVLPLGLDDLAREGARIMIAHALRIEADDYVRRHSGERAEDGRALVVGNGSARPRPVTLGSGTVEVKAPRVNDKRVVDGRRQRFRSRILPPYARRSPQVEAVLPLLYLRGLSTGEFRARRRKRRSAASSRNMGRCTRRRPSVSPTTRRSCSPSTTSRKNTGSTCARPTRSSRPSRRRGCARG